MRFTIYDLRLPVETRRAPRWRFAAGDRQSAIGNRQSGFTMIEIALCLAIIGFALISILLVLPLGMNTQRDTRQQTIIAQDASMLLEAIRNGSRGLDDLTNNVYAITNYWTAYNADGSVNGTGVNSFTYATAFINGSTQPFYALTNGANIIGQLSVPEFLSGGRPISSTFNTTYTSNHVVAYVRSFSGLAAEKPPQDNQIMQGDTFAYRLFCVNAPAAVDTNAYANSLFARQLAGNVHELRLTFLWPQQPNGNVGGYRQTFRASVSGLLAQDATYNNLYFYQSHSFTNAP
jgi:type II secretory pathway pseudopilin PulG